MTDIDVKYAQLGGAGGFLGSACHTGERRARRHRPLPPLPGRLDLLDGRDAGARGARRDPRQVVGAGLGAELPRLSADRRDRDARWRRPVQPLPGRLDLLDARDGRPRGARRDPRQVVVARLGAELPRLPADRRDVDARRRRPLQPLPGRLGLLDAGDRRPRGARRDPREVVVARLGAELPRLPAHRRDHDARRRRPLQPLPGRLDLLDAGDRRPRGARRDPRRSGRSSAGSGASSATRRATSSRPRTARAATASSSTGRSTGARPPAPSPAGRPSGCTSSASRRRRASASTR